MTVEDFKTLEKELINAQAIVIDTGIGGIVVIRMHFYTTELIKMFSFMNSRGYQLVSVLRVEHRICSESVREFYFTQ